MFPLFHVSFILSYTQAYFYITPFHFPFSLYYTSSRSHYRVAISHHIHRQTQALEKRISRPIYIYIIWENHAAYVVYNTIR